MRLRLEMLHAQHLWRPRCKDLHQTSKGKWWFHFALVEIDEEPVENLPPDIADIRQRPEIKKITSNVPDAQLHPL